MSHWLCILNRENFEVVKHKGIWGVSKRHRNQLMRADVGDKLIFYLIGEKIGDEKKDSAIGAAYLRLYPHLTTMIRRSSQAR